ncbi:MAG: AraC family transcriptional regulator [Treponema sp.]|nr:AraC family transcriptional regulator [Treponema sp.]
MIEGYWSVLIGLKNLAFNFGFCDEFHLSSSFKKKFGVSPGRFGKNI